VHIQVLVTYFSPVQFHAWLKQQCSVGAFHLKLKPFKDEAQAALFNPLNVKLNPICHLMELLGAHHILHVSRIRVKDPVRTAQ